MLIYVIEVIMNYVWLDKLLQEDIHGFLSVKHPKHNALHIWFTQILCGKVEEISTSYKKSSIS